MHVLTAALALHLDDALHLRGDGQLPAQLGGKVLGRGQREGAGTDRQEGALRPRQLWRDPSCSPAGASVPEGTGSEVLGKQQ